MQAFIKIKDLKMAAELAGKAEAVSDVAVI